MKKKQLTKILCACITLALLIGMVCMTTVMADGSYDKGDVNRDGEMLIDDVTLIQKSLAALETLDEEQEALADVDIDGEVTIADATTIQKVLAELMEMPGQPTTTEPDKEDFITTGKIYFEPSGVLDYATGVAVADMRIHIYDISPVQNGGYGDLYAWGTKKAAMTWSNSRSSWQADIATLISGTDNEYFKQGFIPGEWYGVIVYDAKTGIQSYDLAFTTDIIGNIIYLDGRELENPIDSAKTSYLSQVKDSDGNKLPVTAAHAVSQYSSRGELFDPDEWGTIDNFNEYAPVE